MNRAIDGLRKGLWPLSPLYGLATGIRNYTFDAGLRSVERLDVPVLAVGNLTVGGTGKTPMVAWLIERARQLGRTPGVLARGYGRARDEELNDEGRLLQRQFPDLLQEQDPDRVAAGRRLQERGADCIIVDDGFQHRRLGRDVDLVCMDARRPVGQGGLLPSGDLRESSAGLRRASIVVLTRAGAIDEATFERRRDWIRKRARKDLPVLAADHVPVDLVVRPGTETQPAESLAGRRVFLLSGIARPEAFADTVVELGAEVVGHAAFADHHRFRQNELDQVAAEAVSADAVVVTTEKDDARIPEGALARAVLRIRLAFITEDPTVDQLGWER